MMRDGATRAMVCRDLEISFTTFDNWLVAYPAFASAYEYGRELSQAFLDELAVRNLDEGGNPLFNTKLYEFHYRMRCRTQSARMKAAKTSADKFEALWQEMADGNMFADEASKAAVVVQSSVQAIELPEMKQLLKEIKEVNGGAGGSE